MNQSDIVMIQESYQNSLRSTNSHDGNVFLLRMVSKLGDHITVL